MINDVIVSDLINSLSDDTIPSLSYLEFLVDFYETELYIVNNLLAVCSNEKYELCNNIIAENIKEWKKYIREKQEELLTPFLGLDEVLDMKYVNKLKRRFFLEDKSIISRILVVEVNNIHELKRIIVQAGVDLTRELKNLHELRKKFYMCYNKIVANTMEGAMF